METKQSVMQAELERLDFALRSNDPNAANIGEAFVSNYPDNLDGLIFLTRIYQSQMRSSKALEIASRAVAIAPKDPLAQLALGETLQAEGKCAEALQLMRRLENEKRFDPAILDQVGNFYFVANRHADAERCYSRVRILQPTNMHALYRLAHTAMAQARLDEADTLLDEIIRRAPHKLYGAYYIRSTVRKQTAEKNHIAELERVLSAPLHSERGEPMLCFALAKEFEDLHDWQRSFSYLKRGADAYRRSIKYNPQQEIANLEYVRQSLSTEFFQAAPEGYNEEMPFFVTGMPRSGTTLVDRILSSHSRVVSIGESSEFWRTMSRHARRTDKVPPLTELDYPAIGKEYCQAIKGLSQGDHLLDKTPTNFICIGAIVAALPKAKIFHLRRNPMDSCYAIYKTPFREGCEYSYNLEELGRYYVAYFRLMEHWRRVLPGKFLDVDYEELVADQENVTRRMIAYADLPWEDDCLSFEKNTSPSLTASAAQVRQPIYRSSVHLWRNYERELAPIIRIFRDEGIPFE